MEEIKSRDDLVSLRNKLMAEVISMRKKYPKKLIDIKKRIDRIELENLLHEELSLDAIQCQLADYVKKKNLPEKMVPDYEKELSDVQQNLKEIEENEILLQENIKNSIDVNSLLEKAEKLRENMHVINVAHIQMKNESPLLKKARVDAIHMIQNEQQWKQNTEHKNEERTMEQVTVVTEQIKETILEKTGEVPSTTVQEREEIFSEKMEEEPET